MTGSTATLPQEGDLLLHAYLDDELDVANALAVKKQIEADPALSTELAGAMALQRVLRERFPVEPIPADLRRRIDARLGLSRRWASHPTWRALAASVLLAIGISSGSTWLALQGPKAPLVIEDVVDNHLRALIASAPIDVASSDRHTVKPWFNGRISESPKVIDLVSEGFPLVGCRIDVMQTKPVPVLVYSRRLHVISLSAIASGNGSSDPALRRSVNGFNLVSWSDGPLTYWAASDLNSVELLAFAKLFRAAPG